MALKSRSTLDLKQPTDQGNWFPECERRSTEDKTIGHSLQRTMCWDQIATFFFPLQKTFLVCQLITYLCLISCY